MKAACPAVLLVGEMEEVTGRGYCASMLAENSLVLPSPPGSPAGLMAIAEMLLPADTPERVALKSPDESAVVAARYSLPCPWPLGSCATPVL